MWMQRIAFGSYNQRMSEQTVLLGVIEFKEAKRIKAALLERGVTVHLISNPVTCSTGGCEITVEMHAAKEHLEAVQDFMRMERRRNLGDLNPLVEAEGLIFDPAQTQAQCPACGHQFSTEKSECPDCGLCFT